MVSERGTTSLFQPTATIQNCILLTVIGIVVIQKIYIIKLKEYTKQFNAGGQQVIIITRT